MLNTGKAKKLEEALNEELLLVPRKIHTPPIANQNKHCCYYRNGYTTQECVALHDKIEELLQAKHLR